MSGPSTRATPGVFGQRVETGQRVRRDRRLDPLDRVARVVVMARLDQDQVKAARARLCILAACSSPAIRAGRYSIRRVSACESERSTGHPSGNAIRIPAWTPCVAPPAGNRKGAIARRAIRQPTFPGRGDAR